MIEKIAGGAVMVAASSGIGYAAAGRFDKRVRELQGLQSGLWLLKNEIHYAASPLPEALLRCAGLVPSGIGSLFAAAAKAIQRQKLAGAGFCEALTAEKNKLHLDSEDYLVLTDFAAGLDSGDTQSQMQNLENTMQRLKLCEENARENRKKYGALCRRLGITAGLFLLIWLL